MFKNKTIKLFLILGVILFSFIGVVGCSNEKVYEKEKDDIVGFPIQYYSVALSSVPGQPIVLTLENASFLVSIDKGSFEYYNDVKERAINSGDTFFCCPTYVVNDSIEIVKEEIFIDIKMLIEEKIVGYCVLKINFDNDLNVWKPEMLVSNLFIDENGKTVSVNDNYANQRISDYHK